MQGLFSSGFVKAFKRILQQKSLNWASSGHPRLETSKVLIFFLFFYVRGANAKKQFISREKFISKDQVIFHFQPSTTHYGGYTELFGK